MNIIDKVCCIGNWSGFNYGAHLTHYALYRTIKDLGFEVSMLEKPDIEPFRPLSSPELFRKNPYDEGDLLPLFSSITEMEVLNDYYNTFVVGSDQLWNYDLFGHSWMFYGLSFVNCYNKKISYSTSLGSVPFKIPYKEKQMFRFLLKQFDYTSVREEDAVEFCFENFGIKPEVLLDPVFLCNRMYYESLLERSDLASSINSKYIFAYIVNFTKRKADYLRMVADATGLRIICVSDALKKQETFGIDILVDVKVEDWLWLINHCEYVVADSFHAYCFSIIFSKYIFPIYDYKKTSNRVQSLSKKLDSFAPIYLQDVEISLKEINSLLEDGIAPYDNLLMKEIERSKDWLEKSLIAPKKDEIIDCQSIVNELYNRVDCLEKKIQKQNDIIKRLNLILLEESYLEKKTTKMFEQLKVDLMNQ